MPDLLVSTQSKIDDELNNDEIIDLDAQKQTVLECLKCEVEKMESQVKSNVSSKLNSLDDDWEQLDDVMKKLLIELVDCELISIEFLQDIFLRKSLFFLLVLKTGDSKGAALVQRKIVMKGSSKQWLHAIRQIILNAETKNHPEELETTE